MLSHAHKERCSKCAVLGCCTAKVRRRGPRTDVRGHGWLGADWTTLPFVYLFLTGFEFWMVKRVEEWNVSRALLAREDAKAGRMGPRSHERGYER